MSTKTQRDPINYNKMLLYYGSDEQMVNEILRGIEHREQSLGPFVESLFQNLKMNYKGIEMDAHDMGSPLYSICAEDALATAQELQNLAKAQDDRAIVSKYLELLEKMREIKRYLDKLYPDRVSNFEEQI